MIKKATTSLLCCNHCGDVCSDNAHKINDLIFCCNGCQMVYGLLREHGMHDYYRFEQTPGTSRKENLPKSFEYLDDVEISQKLKIFDEGGISKVVLLLPQIHCSACLWLLENISKLDSGILKSTINFTSKKATITFRNSDTSLKSVVELLTKIGYEPTINYDDLSTQNKENPVDSKLLYKLGLAGFSFGNIMLLSFPEYLGFDKASYLFHIGYINIILAIPVLLYSGIDYIKSAYRGLLQRTFNLDFPIALGMVALFARSIFEIMSKQGEGYLDSFAGFVFFLLIGRWFQSYTYSALDFDRNYKSYFPVSTSIKTRNGYVSKSIDQLAPGDIIRIRNLELIPTDAIVTKGKARVDYSFVTGEADLISKSKDEIVFAGGRHNGQSIELEVLKAVDQSYLTQLWNEDTFKDKEATRSSKLVDYISKYFTFIILTLAFGTLIYWLIVDPFRAFNAFTSVLIVACPCALALAIPFTYGNIIRMLSAKGFYLKNTQTIESIQHIDTAIFDKTGTITDPKKIQVEYEGKSLTNYQKTLVKSACSHSSHPLSNAIVKELSGIDTIDVDYFEDVIGQGFYASENRYKIKIGSSAFIFGTQDIVKEQGVFIEINNVYLGRFKFKHAFRKNISNTLSSLKKQFELSILSGDTDHESKRVQDLVGNDVKLYFNQSPKNKLQKIQVIQNRGNRVMMIGDGLNDAGALKQADVGIVVSDQSNNFSPACDAIIDAQNFRHLYEYINYLKSSKNIIYGAFILAFFYNAIGIYYAVSGLLSPVIAAILMPLSSISIIIYGVVSSWWLLRHKIKK